jgi:hypothetical protein
MSYSFYVNNEYEFVLIRPWGEFTEDEFIDVSRAFYNHPTREPDFAHIWDTQSIDRLVMDANVIDMYRAFLAENSDRSSSDRVAIIATRTMVETLSRMLAELNRQQTNQEISFFNDLASAASWLGLPLEVLTDIPASAWMTSE